MLLTVEIYGLCIVQENSGGYHRVIAVEPDWLSPVPDHDLVASVKKTAILYGDPGLQELLRQGHAASSLQAYDFKLPDCTQIGLSTPTSTPPSGSLSGPAYRPAELRHLGLQGLKPGAGSGDWVAGEAGRLLLPVRNSVSAWIRTVGCHRFPATGDTFEVADLFVWQGEYDVKPTVTVTFENGTQVEVKIETDHDVELAAGSKPAHEKGTPFGYCRIFERTCHGSWNPGHQPESLQAYLRHPGSSSCPPVKG